MTPMQIFETVLYAEDLAAAEAFYTRVMGLEQASRMADRGMSLRCRDSVLLVFYPRRTRVHDLEVPAHGCTGAGHAAFLVDPADLDAWRARLKANGVAIETEVNWPQGGTSIYFRDPAGNSVELAPPTLWGFRGISGGKLVLPEDAPTADTGRKPEPQCAREASISSGGLSTTLVDPQSVETLHVFGHQFWIRLPAAATGGALGVFEQYSLPGTGVPLHYHEREEETFYVLSGQVEFLMGDTTRLAGPGTTLFVPRRAVHGLKVHGDEPLRLHLTLTPGGGEAMFRELAALGPAPEQTKVDTVCRRYGCVFV